VAGAVAVAVAGRLCGRGAAQARQGLQAQVQADRAPTTAAAAAACVWRGKGCVLCTPAVCSSQIPRRSVRGCPWVCVGVRGGATAAHTGAVAQGRVADVLAHRQGQGGDGGLARGAAGGGGEGGPEAAAGKTQRVCRSAPRSRRAGFAWSLWLRSARSGRAGGSILYFCFNSRRGTVFLRTTTRTSTATRLPPSWPC
jgi:hypothetical protein